MYGECGDRLDSRLDWRLYCCGQNGFDGELDGLLVGTVLGVRLMDCVGSRMS